MTNDTKIIPLAGRRKIKYASDAVGTLQEALACAKENEVAAVAIAMIDEDNEEFYLISEGAARPALLGTLDIVKDVILDELREDDGAI